jgi:ABC-type uncharacterized transport system auxiliary subunit
MPYTTFVAETSMALSNKTIENLAVALTPEVIEYIYADERWIDFMIEMTSDAIKEKLGTDDITLVAEIGQCIIENLMLRACQTS